MKSLNLNAGTSAGLTLSRFLKKKERKKERKKEKSRFNCSFVSFARRNLGIKDVQLMLNACVTFNFK